MKRVITLTGLAMAIGLASMGAQAADYVAGKDYRVLDNPETISGDAIIVREFFWYGCPHCNVLDPHMEKWAKTKDKDVVFFKTPAALNPVWEANARGFYAAQLLGFEDKTHSALFDAIHKDGKKLFRYSMKGAAFIFCHSDITIPPPVPHAQFGGNPVSPWACPIGPNGSSIPRK